jgi:hypothetical protein
MSTHIKIERVCLYCSHKFIAKTTTTKYCSHRCNQRHYKLLKKEEKIKKVNQIAKNSNALLNLLANENQLKC